MLSLSFSSNFPTPVSSSPPATPTRRKTYYVVSAGRCTGVFDNWFVSYLFSYHSRFTLV
jgi:hypothetical protein